MIHERCSSVLAGEMIIQISTRITIENPGQFHLLHERSSITWPWNTTTVPFYMLVSDRRTSNARRCLHWDQFQQRYRVNRLSSCTERFSPGMEISISTASITTPTPINPKDKTSMYQMTGSAARDEEASHEMLTPIEKKHGLMFLVMTSLNIVNRDGGFDFRPASTIVN
jgi:hypothetical protein